MPQALTTETGTEPTLEPSLTAQATGHGTTVPRGTIRAP